MNQDDMVSIYKEYAQAILKYLHSLKCDLHTAEDLVQETFYQAIRSISRYDGSCKISVWLCQIAKHLWYREIGRRNKLPINKIPENSIDPAVIADVVIEHETKNQLRQIISDFPDISRQVIHYRIDENMSFREIGFVMGKSENWARVTYHRCKEKIVEKWREKYEY